MRKTELNLPWKDDNKFIINNEYLKPFINDLLEFLDGEDYMNSLGFAKKMMMRGEIKSNNMIEGITDDFSFIDETLAKKEKIAKFDKQKRVINLYHGYKFILSQKDITKDSLRELYQILSDGILDEYDLENLGDYYRTKPVYIRKGKRIDRYFKGIDEDKIEYYMDYFFDYVNENNDSSSIDSFIKSQIMHLYFVYVHPYLDVNGRTSRTVSMWHLLNNESYPYIIFNRAITYASRDYESKIINSNKTGEMTLFLKYMLTHVQIELEREYIIHQMAENLNTSFSKEEHLILEYLLTMKGNTTVLDIVKIYNNFNNKKDSYYVLENYIIPLIHKGALVEGENTSRMLSDGKYNFWVHLNGEILNEKTKEKVKKIDVNKLIY